jgi:hypothetical protein
MSNDAWVSVAAILVAIIFGLYNAIQTQLTNASQRATADLARRTADTVESRDLIQMQYEILRTILVSEALAIRQRTAVADLRFRARRLQSQPPAGPWSAQQLDTFGGVIKNADSQIAGLDATIDTYRKMSDAAIALTDPSAAVKPSSEVRQHTHAFLQQVQTDQVRQQTAQATYDDWFTESDRVLSLL